MNYKFKEDDLVILIGAGASVEADIPSSSEMIKKIEDLLLKEENQKFKELYDYIKSSIYYSDGIRGKFDDQVNYNIERLVNTLEELRKKKEHVLYPFVGSWNPSLTEVAGNNFERTGEFSDFIKSSLRTKWISLKTPSKAKYFKKLEDLHKEYSFPIKVFTLNYDLCIEKNCSIGSIERGFDEQNYWDWRRYDDSIPDKKPIYLYKLHGSTDWFYDENNLLTFSEDPSSIDDAAIIFGTTYKLQYKDPFLFYAYEFRRWTLESKLILCIGYGFGDEHINQIIRQSLLQDNNRMLLSVSPFSVEEISEENKIKTIENTLNMDSTKQIQICNLCAKQFMNEKLNLNYLGSIFPVIKEDLFDEIKK